MYEHRYDPANIRERDLDEAGRQGESMLAWLETAQEELDQITGTGEAPSRQVKAVVDADGRVLQIVYGPRATRLPSLELAEETLAAVREACTDAQRQIHDLLREALPGYDPAEANARLEDMLSQWS
ncbi:YbaB/EbfC family nucleoid-associated protein [Streptosporangium sp. NPDC000396]|uniref:YbaB/EbfC family nucleoid-associated protein n=1 Tax=Streptosporangium sp. NPDC000396 TaxID=3366185 RepID=UPI0036C1626D